MRKELIGKNNVTYATNGGFEVTVDEVIEFLEKHRGKIFINGACFETAFCADEDTVVCDELYTLLREEDQDLEDEAEDD